MAQNSEGQGISESDMRTLINIMQNMSERLEKQIGSLRQDLWNMQGSLKQDLKMMQVSLKQQMKVMLGSLKEDMVASQETVKPELAVEFQQVETCERIQEQAGEIKQSINKNEIGIVNSKIQQVRVEIEKEAVEVLR
jgi:hypothetical protein